MVGRYMRVNVEARMILETMTDLAGSFNRIAIASSLPRREIDKPH